MLQYWKLFLIGGQSGLMFCWPLITLTTNKSINQINPTLPTELTSLPEGSVWWVSWLPASVLSVSWGSQNIPQYVLGMLTCHLLLEGLLSVVRYSHWLCLYLSLFKYWMNEKSISKCLLASLAAKKLVATRWKHPDKLSLSQRFLTFFDVVHTELSTTRVIGVNESNISLWISAAEKLKERT